MLISLIAAMRNGIDRHDSNDEYRKPLIREKEGKCLIWRDSRRDFTRWMR